jgi:hypothetical protein
VTLTETGASTGVFGARSRRRRPRWRAPTTRRRSTRENGDTLTASYIDVADERGRQRHGTSTRRL